MTYQPQPHFDNSAGEFTPDAITCPACLDEVLAEDMRGQRCRYCATQARTARSQYRADARANP